MSADITDVIHVGCCGFASGLPGTQDRLMAEHAGKLPNPGAPPFFVGCMQMTLARTQWEEARLSSALA